MNCKCFLLVWALGSPPQSQEIQNFPSPLAALWGGQQAEAGDAQVLVYLVLPWGHAGHFCLPGLHPNPAAEGLVPPKARELA